MISKRGAASLAYVATALLATATCSGAGQPGHTFEIVEEDGVPVAVSSAIPKYDGELFAYEKVLVIRPDPRNEESFLYRPYSFTLGDDGLYYVVDGGNHRVAVFDAEGNFLRAFGREGEGPGELRNPLFLEVRDGVVSVLGSRTTRFRTDGTFIDVLSHPSGRFAQITGDGKLFLVTGVGERRADGNYSASRALVVDDGDVVATVETAAVRMEPMLAYRGAPTVLLVPGDEILATTGAEPTISWYGLDGRLKRKARIELPAEPVTEADRAAIENLWDRRIERARRSDDVVPVEGLLHLKQGVLYPETKAYWRRPIVDDSGWVWLTAAVADTGLGSPGRAPVETRPWFRILDPRGEFVGITEWPPEAVTLGGSTIVRGHLLTMVWDAEAGEVVPTVYRIRPAVEGLVYPHERYVTHNMTRSDLIVDSYRFRPYD